MFLLTYLLTATDRVKRPMKRWISFSVAETPIWTRRQRNTARWKPRRSSTTSLHTHPKATSL